MNNVFFIADTHFCHKNILEYEKENRPFASIKEHDEELIARWNSVVKPNDIVFHLGDFCLGGAANVIEIGRCLNGRKRLVMGNHDVYILEYYQAVFERIYGSIFYKEFILSHVPLHPDHTKCMVNIHGHTHSRKVKRIIEIKQYPFHDEEYDENYFCVSAEQNNLTPINIQEIRKRLEAL